MAHGTGRHIFGSGITRAAHALTFTEEVSVVEIEVVTL